MKLINLKFLAAVGLLILSILNLGVEAIKDKSSINVNGISSEGASVSFHKWASLWGSRALKETCGVVDGPVLDARRQWVNKLVKKHEGDVETTEAIPTFPLSTVTSCRTATITIPTQVQVSDTLTTLISVGTVFTLPADAVVDSVLPPPTDTLLTTTLEASVTSTDVVATGVVTTSPVVLTIIPITNSSTHSESEPAGTPTPTQPTGTNPPPPSATSGGGKSATDVVHDMIGFAVFCPLLGLATARLF